VPLVGWLLFLVGASAAYAAFKGERITDVVTHAINPDKFAANPTLSSGSTGPPTSPSGNTPPGIQTEGYTSGSAPGQVAVGYAQAQLGKPYEWGGSGPNSFDCSGLVMRAYGAAGKVLPHFSQAQYAATAVHSLPIQPGNNYPIGSLVFFGLTIAGIDHVGIVNGPDSMIEAPHTGDVVKVYSISAESKPLVAVTNALGGGGNV
jgi:cell wall-associated NlpC family hydrolase